MHLPEPTEVCVCMYARASEYMWRLGIPVARGLDSPGIWVQNNTFRNSRCEWVDPRGGRRSGPLKAHPESRGCVPADVWVCEGLLPDVLGLLSGLSSLPSLPSGSHKALST